MVNRDGEMLYAVALARQFASGAQTNLSTRLQSPTDQLALALDILANSRKACSPYASSMPMADSLPPFRPMSLSRP